MAQLYYRLLGSLYLVKTLAILLLSTLLALVLHYGLGWTTTIVNPLFYTFFTIITATSILFAITFVGKPLSINHFFFISFLQLIMRRPMLLSQLRVPFLDLLLPGASSMLDDLSLDGQKDFENLVISLRKTLISYPEKSITPAQRFSQSVLLWYLDILQEGFKQFKIYAYPLYLFSLYPINQMEGVQSALPAFLLNTHQITSYRGAKDYIARVIGFDKAMKDIIIDIKMREKDGTLPPRFVLERVLKEISEAWCSPQKELSKNALFSHFELKLKQLSQQKQVTDSQQKLLLAALKEVLPSVTSAYDKLAEELKRMIPNASTDDGLWRLKDGERMYSYFLRFFTTTDLSPAEIHKLGLDEVERIHGEIKSLLQEEGIEYESISQAFKALNEDKAYLEDETNEGRERVINKYKEIITQANSKVLPLFDLKPDIGVDVERVPEFKENGAPMAYYMPPPIDRSKGGVFYCNLKEVRAHPGWAMRTLAHHEAIPGHHYQLTVAQKLKHLPDFRRHLPFMAYTEGWGLYAEHLCYEHGLLPTNLDKLGFFQAELWRAARLVVDTGIHALKWTREQAIDYMINSAGMQPEEARIEVERYIVWPGQACAYKIGQLKILELRTKAQKELKDKFSLPAFHNTLLTSGALPLSHLEIVVSEWIKSITKTNNK